MTDIASRRQALGIVRNDPGPNTDMAVGMAVSVLADNLKMERAECDRLEGEVDRLKVENRMSHEMCEAMRRRAEIAESALATKQAAFDEGRQMVTDAMLAQARAEERATAAEAARLVAVEALNAERNRPTIQPAASAATLPAPVKAWLLQSRDAQGNPRTVRMTPEY
jgi:hypothetical protein